MSNSMQQILIAGLGVRNWARKRAIRKSDGATGAPSLRKCNFKVACISGHEAGWRRWLLWIAVVERLKKTGDRDGGCKQQTQHRDGVVSWGASGAVLPSTGPLSH